MSDYLLIESRDPFQNDYHYYQKIAGSMLSRGQKVTLFLVENGVFPVRGGCRFSSLLTDLAEQGVDVMADEFSLSERGISKDELVAGVVPAPLDTVIDMMAIGRKVIWR